MGIPITGSANGAALRHSFGSGWRRVHRRVTGWRPASTSEASKEGPRSDGLRRAAAHQRATFLSLERCRSVPSLNSPSLSQRRVVVRPNHAKACFEPGSYFAHTLLCSLAYERESRLLPRGAAQLIRLLSNAADLVANPVSPRESSNPRSRLSRVIGQALHRSSSSFKSQWRKHKRRAAAGLLFWRLPAGNRAKIILPCIGTSGKPPHHASLPREAPNRPPAERLSLVIPLSNSECVAWLCRAGLD